MLRHVIWALALPTWLFGTAAALAQAPAPPAPAAPGTPIALSRVLDAVNETYNQQQMPVVVFDLDGTLFDTRPRLLQILKEYAEHELRTVRPTEATKLAALSLGALMPSVAETMRRLGITEEAVISNAEVYRAERFFTDDYVKFDQPVAGAVKFVRALYTAGARIAYLTDRDVGRQLLGTVKALRDYGFPIGIPATELMMRPTMQTQDAVFKQKAVSYLRQYGKIIATFGVEPTNADLYRRAFPEAAVVLLDLGRPSGQPRPVTPNVQVLERFD